MNIQTQDQMEFRDMLQGLAENVAELRIAVQQNRSDVPALMESVQMVSYLRPFLTNYAHPDLMIGTQDSGSRSKARARFSKNAVGATFGDQ
jgi:hypothetical protein